MSENYERWLRDAVELIRECRLADAKAARGGGETRRDEAFYRLFRFEHQAGAILPKVQP